jgi:aminoglycoside phosphotransferase (APT) family kinase protein
MLDWELSTIGHPLADLSYWCSMLYHGETEFPDNHKELGLLSEQETLDLYCELTNRRGIENWNFYIAFNLFRSAAIRQGVYKRGLDGNASSDQWQVSGEGAMNAAHRAWALVKEAGLA